MKVQNKLVVVTGASRGIGAALAKRLAERGARVVILARNQEHLETLAVELRQLGQHCWSYAVDLADGDKATSVAERIIREAGVPDIVINNAGAGRFRYAHETSPAEAVEMMALPYFAAFYVTRVFLPHMLKRNSGHIVNMTSPAAIIPFPGSTGYSTARWAMRGFTEALRADLHGTGIRVTLAMPGKVASSYWAHNDQSEERVPAVSKLLPTLTTEQAARVIVRGIECNKRMILSPLMLKLFYWLNWMCPRLVEFLVHRTGHKQK